jgi:hypothetical protein
LLPFCSFGSEQVDFVVPVVVKSGGWWEFGRVGGSAWQLVSIICLANLKVN